MAEQVVTELTIDARGADEGSATYVKAMTAAQAAADRVIDAQNAAAAAQEKQTAIMTGGAQSIAKVAAAYDKLRASIDPVAKAEMDAQAAMNKAIITADNAVKQGLATQEQAAATIAALKEKQLAGIQAVIAATEEETAVTKIAEQAIDSAKEFATGLIAGLGAGVLFSELTELPDKIKDAVHEAAGLDHVAETIGVTTDQLQQLQYAGSLFHESTEGMDSALEKFSKTLGGAGASSSALGKAFAANHVAITGDLMKDFANYANIVEHASNAQQKNYLVTTAFGKGSAELGNMFANGAEGVKQLADQAVIAGAVLDHDMLETAKSLDAEFTVLQIKSGIAFKEFAISIAPAILIAMMAISGVMDLIGSHLDIIGRVAAIAGAALLGYFGPVALVAIGDLSVAIGVGLVNAIRAVGVAMLENPLGLLIGGIAAVIVAVFMFRDQIKAAIGIDVVGVITDTVDYTIGAFVGAYNGIKDTWAEMPGALGDIVLQAANSVITGTQSMINGAIDLLDGFITSANDKLGALHLPTIGTIGHVDFGSGIANPFAGDAAAVNDKLNQDSDAAMKTHYLGNVGGAIGSAYNSIMKVPTVGIAGGEGEGNGSSSTGAGAGQSTSYSKVLQSAQADTANLVAQQQALGQTTFQAAKLEEQQKLLNDATKKGNDLSPTQLADIDAAATKYAEQKAKLEELTIVYNEGKQAVEDFASTLKSDLMSGTSLWASFGDAASKALDDIANKALQMAADGVWDMIFKSFTGGSSGGSFNILSLFGLGGSSSFSGATAGASAGGSFFGGAFASGTSYAPGGLSLVGEQGPELVNLTRGAQVFTAPQTRQMMAANSNAANNNVTVAPVYNFNGSSFTEAQAKRLISDSNKQLVTAMPGIMADKRRRAVPGAH